METKLDEIKKSRLWANDEIKNKLKFDKRVGNQT